MGRQIILLAAIGLACISCQQKLPGAAWQPADAAAAAQSAELISTVARMNYEEDMPVIDETAMLTLFTEDIVLVDETFADGAAGITKLTRMANNINIFFPKLDTEVVDTFIAADEGLAIYRMWNLDLKGYRFTPDDPLLGADLYQVRDRHIWHWDAFYGADTISKFERGNQERAGEMNALLTAYGQAWSAGSETAVGHLYAPDALRIDKMFGENQQGSQAIIAYAQTLFDRFPGMVWQLEHAFGDGKGSQPVTGGIWNILIEDAGGTACELRSAVLLQEAGGMIKNERVFYEPQSLFRCGWAQ
jgi:ketosteroid isomerase-like protein